MHDIDAGPVLPSHARSFRDKIRYGRRHEASLLSGPVSRVSDSGASVLLNLLSTGTTIMTSVVTGT